MNIHVYYRHAAMNNVGRHRPNWFNYEKCFKNFLDTIEGKDNIILNVVMDGDISGNFIEKYKSKFNLIQVNYRSDYESWKYILDYVNRQPIDGNDLIYFLENDYLHVPNWSDKIFELFKTYSGLTYVSLYDHNDKYFAADYDSLVSKIITTASCHWRTVPSTCSSFILTKNLLAEDIDIWQRAGRGDHFKFLELGETRSRFVFNPMPGLSTHCMAGLLSPTINWEKINNDTQI